MTRRVRRSHARASGPRRRRARERRARPGDGASFVSLSLAGETRGASRRRRARMTASATRAPVASSRALGGRSRNRRVVAAANKSGRDDRRRVERNIERDALERRRDAAVAISRVVKDNNLKDDRDERVKKAVPVAGWKPPELTPEVIKEEIERERYAFVNEVSLMFISGAILGPLLDHQHSRFDVLHYASPLQIHFDVLFAPLWQSPFGVVLNFLLPEVLQDFFRIIFVNESGVLETGWWVPLLFGFAAVVIGSGHTFLDQKRIRASVRRAREIEIRKGAQGAEQQVSSTSDLINACPGKPAFGFKPGWVAVNVCIGVFSFQYLVSGILASPQSPLVDGFLPYHLIDLVLCVWALLMWRVFDGTAQGFFMASLTAVAGPAAEILLINFGHLYAYSHSDLFGIPTWIPWVYFCGGPAVGNLSRQTRNELREMSGLPGPTTRVVAYSKRRWDSAKQSEILSKSSALNSTAYSALEPDKRVINKNLKEIPKGRFTILAGGPIDVDLLVKKRREEEELAVALQSARGGTQKRRRAVRKFVARQNDIKAGRKSVRERIVSLLVRRKVSGGDETTDTSEEGKIKRLQKIQREIARVEATLDEIDRMKKLKQRLETIKTGLDDAAPPLLPKLARLKSRIDDVVPAPFKPTFQALEDAIGESIVPIVREKAPESVRKAMEGSYDSEEDRRAAIERMNGELVAIQSELTKAQNSNEEKDP